MIGIFCYLGAYPNVVSPFVVVSIKIREDERDNIKRIMESKIDFSKLDSYSYKDLLKLLKRLNGYCNSNTKKQKRILEIFTYTLGKLELEKYGIPLSFRKAISFFRRIYLDEVIYSSSDCIELEHPFFRKEYLSSLELVLAYIYSKVFRYYYLNRYEVHYEGKLCRQHVVYLESLTDIPDYYIETELVNQWKEQKLVSVPKWLEKYEKYIK